MMRYVILNEDGVVKTMFLESPPQHAVSAPDFVEPGYRLVNGEFIAPLIDIETMRNRAVTQVNNLYATIRKETPGVPYAEKQIEALEVIRMVERGENPNGISASEMMEAFPVLSASVGTEVDTLSDAAALILKRHKQASIFDNEIESIRLRAKKDIRSALSLADIEAAYHKAIHALEALADNGG